MPQSLQHPVRSAVRCQLTRDYSSWTALTEEYYNCTTYSSAVQFGKVHRFPAQVQIPNPQWELISRVLDTKVMGYAYSILQDGEPIRNVWSGNARAPQDGPLLDDGFVDSTTRKLFTADTRINLASVSKAICGIAIMKAYQDGLLGDKTLDDAFWPFLADSFPTNILQRINNTDSNIGNISIRNLLNMKVSCCKKPSLVWNSSP